MSATAAIATTTLDNFDTVNASRIGEAIKRTDNLTQYTTTTTLYTSLLPVNSNATANAVAANVIGNRNNNNSNSHISATTSASATSSTGAIASRNVTTFVLDASTVTSPPAPTPTVTSAATATVTHATLTTAVTLPTMRHLETSTDAFPVVQTVATTFIAGNKNRATTIIVYPTVSPESIVIPIVSCIFGFPILALIVICCLRRRAKLARERDRRRNYDMQDHAVSLVRFSPIHRLNYRSSRAISLRPERSLSQGFTSLELDTVMEERCSDIEQTQTEIINAESPLESTSCKLSFSSS